MRVDIDRGLALLFSRHGIWAAALVGLALLGGYGWPGSAPPESADDALRIHQQWRRLAMLRAELQAELQDARPQAFSTRAFSPLELPVAGATLIAWRPLGRGGEIQLAVEWPAAPAIFAWLAGCGMRATAFSLHPDQGALQLTMLLEAEDET